MTGAQPMTVISLVFKGSRPWADAGRQIAEADKAPESDAVGASTPRGTRGAVNALVIDASITVKWVVDEPGTPEALLLLRKSLPRWPHRLSARSRWYCRPSPQCIRHAAWRKVANAATIVEAR